MENEELIVPRKIKGIWKNATPEEKAILMSQYILMKTKGSTERDRLEASERVKKIRLYEEGVKSGSIPNSEKIVYSPKEESNILEYSPGNGYPSSDYVPIQNGTSLFADKRENLANFLDNWMQKTFSSYGKVLEEMKDENYYNLEKFSDTSKGEDISKKYTESDLDKMIRDYEMDIDFASNLKKENPIVSLSFFNNLKKRRTINQDMKNYNQRIEELVKKKQIC
jgi:hypothetical protein